MVRLPAHSPGESHVQVAEIGLMGILLKIFLIAMLSALAQRVALEMLKQFDSEIAYQTRFDKTKTSVTRMLFLTEGVLLRQMVDDPSLQRYNVIILDEVIIEVK